MPLNPRAHIVARPRALPVVIGIALVILLAACGSGDDDLNPESTASPQPTVEVTESADATSVSSDEAEETQRISVNEVDLDYPYTGSITLGEGNRIVAIDVTIENLTQDQISYSNVDMYLEDDEGFRYSHFGLGPQPYIAGRSDTSRQQGERLAFLRSSK